MTKCPATTPIPVQLSEPEFSAFIFLHLSMPKRGPNGNAIEPELRISFDCFACARDRRLAWSEGISDEAGEDVDHGVPDGPVA